MLRREGPRGLWTRLRGHMASVGSYKQTSGKPWTQCMEESKTNIRKKVIYNHKMWGTSQPMGDNTYIRIDDDTDITSLKVIVNHIYITKTLQEQQTTHFPSLQYYTRGCLVKVACQSKDWWN